MNALRVIRSSAGRVTVAQPSVIAQTSIDSAREGQLALTVLTEMIFIITGSVSDHGLLAEKVRPLVPVDCRADAALRLPSDLKAAPDDETQRTSCGVRPLAYAI